MKALKYISASVCFFAAMLISTDTLYAWGQKGHDTVCAIAENHLTNKAKKEISYLLDGKSIVYWANWMDNASNNAEYAYTKTWHYKDVDENETYETVVENENGDAERAIAAQIAALKSGTLNKEAAAISLKMLIHLVGDFHCPMHMGHKSDAGGNRYQVQFFGNGTNLHSVWDSGIIERAHAWTYTEWAEQIDNTDKKEREEIAAGTLADWGKQTYEVSKDIYAKTPVGSKLSYNEVAYWAPVVEQQLLRGGIRLASILNDIFK